MHRLTSRPADLSAAAPPKARAPTAIPHRGEDPIAEAPAAAPVWPSSEAPFANPLHASMPSDAPPAYIPSDAPP